MQFVLWVTFLALPLPNNAGAYPEGMHPKIFTSMAECEQQLPSVRAGYNRRSNANLYKGMAIAECKNTADLPSGWNY